MDTDPVPVFMELKNGWSKDLEPPDVLAAQAASAAAAAASSSANQWLGGQVEPQPLMPQPTMASASTAQSPPDWLSFELFEPKAGEPKAGAPVAAALTVLQPAWWQFRENSDSSAPAAAEHVTSMVVTLKIQSEKAAKEWTANFESPLGCQ
jgi:hypothetical protein